MPIPKGVLMKVTPFISNIKINAKKKGENDES